MCLGQKEMYILHVNYDNQTVVGSVLIKIVEDLGKVGFCTQRTGRLEGLSCSYFVFGSIKYLHRNFVHSKLCYHYKLQAMLFERG